MRKPEKVTGVKRRRRRRLRCPVAGVVFFLDAVKRSKETFNKERSRGRRLLNQRGTNFAGPCMYAFHRAR